MLGLHARYRDVVNHVENGFVDSEYAFMLTVAPSTVNFSEDTTFTGRRMFSYLGQSVVRPHQSTLYDCYQSFVDI